MIQFYEYLFQMGWFNHHVVTGAWEDHAIATALATSSFCRDDLYGSQGKFGVFPCEILDGSKKTGFPTLDGNNHELKNHHLNYMYY